MRWKQRLFDPGHAGAGRDFGLLVLRLGLAGSLIFAHGWGKLIDFADKATRFPDPLGIGSTASLGLVTFAEVFCAIALIIGLMSRLATLPLIATFLVAFFMVHGADPFREKELALVYLIAFGALLATGPGRFSLDGLIRGR